MNALHTAIGAVAPKSEFARNVVTMLTSRVAARALLVIALPIISRFCAPEDVGIWQMFTSVAMICATAICLRYELAIVLPEERDRAWHLLLGCGALAMILSAGVAAATFVAAPQLAALIGAPELASTLWCVPAFTLAFGIEQALSYWLTRHKQFALIGSAVFLKSLATVTVQVGLLMAFGGRFVYLVCGSVLGQALAAGLLAAFVWQQDRFALQTTSLASIREVLWRYRSYPAYVAPYAFANQFSKRLVLVLLGIMASQHEVGLFVIAMQLTYIPVTFFSATLRQVFYQRLASDLRNGHLEGFARRVFMRMAFVLTPWTLLFALDGAGWLSILLGERWLGVGDYAAWMCLPAFMLFFTSWLDRLFDVVGRQRLSVCLQIGSDTVSIGAFFGTLWLYGTHAGVAAYAVVTAVYNVLWLLITYRVSGLRVQTLLGVLRISSLWIVAVLGLRTAAQALHITAPGLWTALVCGAVQAAVVYRWKHGGHR